MRDCLTETDDGQIIIVDVNLRRPSETILAQDECRPKSNLRTRTPYPEICQPTPQMSQQTVDHSHQLENNLAPMTLNCTNDNETHNPTTVDGP